MSEQFPEAWIQYSKEKLRTQRDTIEYLALFGPPFLKGSARMILAAVGEDWQEKALKNPVAWSDKVGT